MVSVLAAVGLAAVVGLHTAIAAVLTRLFRVRLSTWWGAIVYTAVVVPVVLLFSTIAVTGFLKVGPDLGGRGAALFLLIGLPLAFGAAIDYVWMPPPDEVELPEPAE